MFLGPEDLPKAVDLNTFDEITLPPDWGSKVGAKMAATKTQTYARLMGHVEFEVSDVSPHLYENLIQARDFAIKPTSSYFNCNEIGEFRTYEYQIPLSRLLACVKSKQISLKQTELQLLNHLLVLQNPDSSPWSQPFIRAVSFNQYSAIKKLLHIKYYIYCSRLVFELISDSAIKCLFENIIDPPCLIRKCSKTPPPAKNV